MFGNCVVPWDRLTMQPAKARLFHDEFVADDCWQTMSETCDDPASFLHDHTFMLFKPEAIARRVGTRVLDALAHAGYQPVAHLRVPLGRSEGNHIWRYQWNAATIDRLRLAATINAQSDSLLVMLRRTTTHDPRPAAVQLWALKGSAHAERRQAHHLRTLIGMRNRMIGFIHTPDEPADFIRELGILLDGSTRRALMEQASWAGAARHEVFSALRALERSATAHPVDFSTLLARFTAGPLRDFLCTIASGARFPLGEIGQKLSAYAGISAWDRITIEAEGIVHDRGNIQPIINSKAVPEVEELWRSRANELAA